jgi:type I restriction enzyme, S subunit
MDCNLAELPEGWAWTTYEQIGKWSGGGTPSKQIDSYWIGGEIPWISPKDMKSPIIYDSEDRITDDAIKSSSAKLIPSDSLLFVVRSGILRRTLPVALTRIDAAVNQDLKALTLSDHIFPDYLLYHALAFNNEIRRSCSKDGTTVESIEFFALKEYPLPLAPLPEQHRIVARIDELFSRLDAGVEALRRARAQLQRYRQSVLQAAVTGRLTAEWREAHPEVEHVEMPSNQADISNLPNNWININLREICTDVTDGDHQPPPQSSEGIPFLVISNIRKGKLDFENTRFVSQEYYDSIPEIRKPSKGEILYSLVGSYGIPVIIDTDRKFCFQRHIGLIRPQKSVDIKYLYYFLKSDLAYRQATAAATGTAQMTVSLKGLRTFQVPFPPLMEQQEIVSQIERVFFVSDQLEDAIESNLIHLDHLRQSILKQAFEGKLVPQDPNDEPASLLLERIRAERTKASPPRGRGRSPKTNQVSLIQ